MPDSLPIGSIIAFAGPATQANRDKLKAAGWLFCDGASYWHHDPGPGGAATEYIDLFGVIRHFYGEGYDEPSTGKPTDQAPKTGDFNVPDLRGRFLRGVDYGIGRDLEASARQASRHGGNLGNEVGSVQLDTFGYHSHRATSQSTVPDHVHQARVPFGTDSSGAKGDRGLAYEDTKPAHLDITTHTTIDPSGGIETRPKNIYVNWIIKYRNV